MQQKREVWKDLKMPDYAIYVSGSDVRIIVLIEMEKGGIKFVDITHLVSEGKDLAMEAIDAQNFFGLMPITKSIRKRIRENFDQIFKCSMESIGIPVILLDENK